jgi:hypothetical protein
VLSSEILGQAGIGSTESGLGINQQMTQVWNINSMKIYLVGIAHPTESENS